MWVGIDVGTGGTRALLVNEAGRVLGSATAPHDEMRMQQPLWAEQEPVNWWDAALTAIRAMLAQAAIDPAEIRGIGLSGQMHGLVLLDAGGEVIRPSLIWCDQRSQPQVDFINNKVGAGKVLQWTANPVLTGFTLPKLLWVREHEPRNFERARHMLLPKDYLRYRLTGRDRAAMRPNQPLSGLQHQEVLPDRDAGNLELCREIGDPRPPVLLDEADDVILALPCEDVLRRAVRGIGHRRSFRSGTRGRARTGGRLGFEWLPGAQ